MKSPSLAQFTGGGPAGPGGPDLIGAYLDRQQDLSAVERFSLHHDEMARSGMPRPSLEGRYRDLIPLEKPRPGQQFAFEVDLDRCTGCKACVTACHNLNGLDANETWRSVGLIHSVRRGQPMQQTITTACQHCLVPGCSDGCPVKAYEKDPITGVVKHLDDQCIGCEYCILKCPYDVPQYHPEKGIVRKCDMCIGRLEVGEAPACVQACPTQAIRITLVEVAAVLAHPEDYASVPGAPDPRHTFPTTRYKTIRKFPEEMEAADAHKFRREKSHLPLVFMLAISQMAAGFYAVLETAGFATAWADHPLFQAWAHGLGLFITLAAMAISITHLGRPLYAFRAVLGLRKSWLSREIVAFGIMAPIGMAAAAGSLVAAMSSAPAWLAWMAPAMDGKPGSALRIALVAVSLLVVHCSAMVYRDTPRVYWATRLTSAKFLLSAAASGITAFLALTTVFALAVPGFAGDIPTLWVKVLVGILPFVLAAKLACEARIQRHVDDQDLNPLKKAALLLRGELQVHHALRFNAGILGGMLLPILWLYRGVGSSTGWDAGLALGMVALVLAGECLERFLFFTACVPPRMPGA